MHNNSRKTKTNETSLYPMSKRQRSDEVNTPPISQFQCEYCNSTFSNLPNLNQHIASFHLKNSSWTCSKCNKQFTNKSNLKVHLRVHTRIKPYHCKNCNYSCMHHSSIKDHIYKNHPGVIHSTMNPAYVFNSSVVPSPEQFNSQDFDKEAFIAEAKELNSKLSAQMYDRIENRTSNKNHYTNEKIASADLSPISTYSANYSDETSISYEQSFSSIEDQYEQDNSKRVDLKANNTAKPKYTSFNIDSLMNDKKPETTFNSNDISNSLLIQSAIQFPLLSPQFNNHFLFNQVNKLQHFYNYLYCMQTPQN